MGENSTVFTFSNRIILRYNRGAQLFLRLEYPNRLGTKIMTKERTQIQSNDEVIRQEVFDKAKAMGPTSDFELAAIRDYVMQSRGLPAGTPGNNPAPPTPAPAKAAPPSPATWPPPPRGRPRSIPPTSSGAASSGLPR